MKEPVDHIVRPRLPWRSPSEPAITECGHDVAKVKTITREAFLARFAEYGRQRTALFTCMTCAETAQRWPTWEKDPRTALEREITWETCRWGASRGFRFRDELEAVAALIDTYPEEFARLVAEVGQRRDWLAKKAKLEGRPTMPGRKKL